jgi:hypothetical protein
MRSNLFIAAILSSGLLACSTHKGFVDYKELSVYSSENLGNHKFTDVGPVSGDATSWVWASCDTVATMAVKDLLDIAKTRGANTVYKITFEGNSGRVTTPTCFKRWGWFAMYVVGGLGPWMTISSAEGIAATTEMDTKASGSINIGPGQDTTELARTYISTLENAVSFDQAAPLNK